MTLLHRMMLRYQLRVFLFSVSCTLMTKFGLEYKMSTSEGQALHKNIWDRMYDLTMTCEDLLQRLQWIGSDAGAGRLIGRVALQVEALDGWFGTREYVAFQSNWLVVFGSWCRLRPQLEDYCAKKKIEIPEPARTQDLLLALIQSQEHGFHDASSQETSLQSGRSGSKRSSITATDRTSLLPNDGCISDLSSRDDRTATFKRAIQWLR
jgi:hypothetical protein